MKDDWSTPELLCFSLMIGDFYDLRQVLFDIRAGNSNLAKSLSKKVTMQCTKMKTYTRACYPCILTKTNHFSSILVTSLHKTDSL